MDRNPTPRRSGVRRLPALAGAIFLLLSVSGWSASHGLAPRARTGGTATYAMGAGYSPDYILPLTNPVNASVANFADFQPLMYRPLFDFSSGGTVAFNPLMSLAGMPTFTVVGGRTVVNITLRPYRWSDGLPVTSRDVQFWMNLLIANKADYFGYVAGEFPDNVVAQHYVSPTRFSLTFNRVYNPYWLLYNELAQITPLPQHAWDRTSVGGAIGNWDMETAGAKAVYHFLNSQSNDRVTYATNPLWQVVDGPWHLTAYSAETSYAALARNPRYSGPQNRGGIAHLELMPFTTDTAEFNSLRAGAVDYGYIPVQDISTRSYFASHGYAVKPWLGWAITYLLFNFTNKTVRPLFNQLYLRQAMQHLIDQPAYIRAVLKGAAVPGYGPVPTEPKSAFVSPGERVNPYPYSPGTSRALLRQHGWSVHANGLTVCRQAGTSPSDCGAGIARGTPLAFTMLYDNAYLAAAQEMQALKSAFSLVGIQLSLKTAPLTTVFTIVNPCTTGPTCTWQLGNWQDPGSWVFIPPFPGGDLLFRCGAFDNSGDYCNAPNDSNIAAVQHSPGLAALYRYEDYVAKQVPVLWLPTPFYQLSAVRSTLHGYLPQQPLETIDPEDWYISS